MYDSAYPNRQDTARVEISMERNLNAPRFNSSRYEVTIFESQATGPPFFTGISATDVDGVCVFIFLVLI